MCKTYIATVASYNDESHIGGPDIAILHADSQEGIVNELNRHFRQEVAAGHEVPGAVFTDISEADGFVAADKSNTACFRVKVAVIEDDSEQRTERIRRWAESSCAHLSNREGYARGYREAYIHAKETVLEMLDGNA